MAISATRIRLYGRERLRGTPYFTYLWRMKWSDLLVKFLVWRIKHVPDRNFVLLLSGVVGALAGLAAVLLKEVVHYIQHEVQVLTEGDWGNYLLLASPAFGILLTAMVARYIFKERLGHGITDILYNISRRSSRIPRNRMYSRMFTSAVTVGLGGSVGLESPIVVTGSAIGSNIGQLVHLDARKRSLLIGCGTAGAIAGIFNSPVAGVIFAIEVILTDVTLMAFIPLLISAVSGALISLSLLGDDVLFSFRDTDNYAGADIPFYLILGIFAGFVSLYFTRAMYKIEGNLERIQSNAQRIALGALGLALIIFIFPPIYGEGYAFIKTLLSGKAALVAPEGFFIEGWLPTPPLLILFLIGVLLIKPVATALTLGAGGSGGIFAPSLFLGGTIGFLTAYLINTTGLATVSIANFTLVGMCGVMAGVLHAPLTAIFLIAEITSGYTLFVPLMLVSAISYNTVSYFERGSLYTKRLLERGDLFRDDKDRQVLSLIQLGKIVEKDLLTIPPDATLGDLVKLVRQSNRNIFPVVNEHQELLGIITLDDIRDMMFDPVQQESVVVRTIMNTPPASVTSRENMQSVMDKFEKTGAWNLPVIDQGQYVGFVSKSRIFNAYRNKLVRQSKS